MDIVKGKISMRQAFVIVILALTAPITRILPIYTTEIAKQASWVSVIFSAVPFIFLIFILARLFKKYPDYSLDQIFELVLGKTISKILLIIYILWFFLLLGAYVRFFAERFLSSILPYTPIEFFIGVILILALIVNKKNIEVFARTVEVLFIIFFIAFLFTFFLLISEIKLENLYPVTTYDIMPALEAVIPSLSIWGYVTFMMFLGEKINHKDGLKKYGIQAVIILTIFSLLVIIGTVGIFGHELIKKFSLPYFITLKNIEILNTAERVEAIFISTWVINDFVIISIIIFTIKNLLKKLLALNNENSTLVPIILIAYVLAFYCADTKFELEKVAATLGAWMNLTLGLGIPLILLIVGKIRKKI